MRGGGPVRLAILFVITAVAACGRGTEPNEVPTTTPDEPMTCESGFTGIAGFEQTRSSQEPYVDHVGIRLDFEDGEGREIHYFAGIGGEFGEGLPANETVPVALGLEATLIGSGTTWVLSWDAPGPCGRRAVLGNGLTHDGFLETIRSAGIVPVQ